MRSVLLLLLLGIGCYNSASSQSPYEGTTLTTTRRTGSYGQSTTQRQPPIQPSPGSTVSEKMCTKYSSHIYEELPPKLMGGPKSRITRCTIPGGSAIFMGQNPAEDEFPHMAAIGYGPKDKVKWRCGGTLISDKFILTAAHCLDTPIGKPQWIRLGALNVSNNNEENLQEFEVLRLFAHPEYRPPSKYHDIALLQVDVDVELNPYVRPACLHTSRDIAEPKATATGWGNVDYFKGNSFSDSLMKEDLSVTTNEYCRAKFAMLPTGSTSRVLAQGIVDDLMLCAGDKGRGKNACGDDSGGPLQIVNKEPPCTYDILAVKSFRIRCAEWDFPSVFTRVSNYVPWIESIVWPDEA